MRRPTRKELSAKRDLIQHVKQVSSIRSQPISIEIRGNKVVSEQMGFMTQIPEEEEQAYEFYQGKKRDAIQAIRFTLDPKQLYTALVWFPVPLLQELLADKEVFRTLEETWLAALDGDVTSRRLLQAIGDAFSIGGPGRGKESNTGKRWSRTQAASRSRSVKRWCKRYAEEYLPLYKDRKKALRQLESEFENQANFQDPSQKALTLREIKRRLPVKERPSKADA